MERLIQMQYVNANFSWDGLSLSEKLKLFNKWSIAILVGNLFTIFGSVFYIMQKHFFQEEISVFIGFGCFFTWISTMRYFSYTKEFSIITITLQTAIPKVTSLQLGILPIFAGFILTGRIWFWQDTHGFNSFSSTSFTLFSVANGDSVWSTFNATT